MSGYFWCRGKSFKHRSKYLIERLNKIGLVENDIIERDDGMLVGWASPSGQVPIVKQCGPDDYIVCAGMFFYEGKFGEKALQSFFDSFDIENPAVAGTRGQFTLLVRKGGITVSLTDRLGANKIYFIRDCTIYSSHFVAIAEACNEPSPDPTGCYQYAWCGAVFGERTFVSSIRTQPVNVALIFHLSLQPQHVVVKQPFLAGHLGLCQDFDVKDDDAVVDYHIHRLQSLMDGYACHLGERFSLSLSGGYDSRLILAAMLARGCKPTVFTYGPEGDAECAIARSIAEGEGLAFEHVDKSLQPPMPVEDFPDYLAMNYGHFDGWKNGGLLDTGADMLDRQRRVSEGKVKVNGSGGEIYRNFFYLPNGRYRIQDVVNSFYASYDPRACTDAFDMNSFDAEMGNSIANAIGVEGDELERWQVELVYPLFRLRYWTGRDLPINQSFGPCLFPFMEPDLIEQTCSIALNLKSYGILEGRMIRKLHPRLASYPSSYGFPFERDPPLRYILKAQLSYRRPTSLRRFSYRLQHRRPTGYPYYLQEPYLKTVIDLGLPHLRNFFYPDRLHDSDVFNRVVTMEYIFERIAGNTTMPAGTQI